MNLKFNFIDAVQLKQTKVVRAKSCLSSSKPKQKKEVFSNIKRKEIEKENKERKKLLFNFGGFRRLDFTYNENRGKEKQHSSSSEEHNKNFILHFTKGVF